ncbi:hypothetical protein FDP22_08395 [Paroceanicella profunda]|uniref:Uncharacterized protein n=1 Tax=Paroceanicella profunda TaxID=2579971 RepID=A0A5B8FYX6_9RHOB|nr:hypothetical protein [Paroceanicella profunda]QDL91792.1 hypothetical protein FDP22_08395 [Paroceanicella profunda]
MSVFGAVYDDQNDPSLSEQAVIIRFSHAQDDMSEVLALEDALRDALSVEGNATVDGYIVDPEDGRVVITITGPRADQIWQQIQALVQKAHLLSGAIITLRHGPAAEGTAQQSVTF